MVFYAWSAVGIWLSYRRHFVHRNETLNRLNLLFHVYTFRVVREQV